MQVGLRWEEGIGLLAFLLNVVGNWMLTSRNSRGWIIRILSNAAQLIYATMIWSPSLILNSATFTVINVLGYRKWKIMESHDSFCGILRTKVCNCGRLA